MTAPPLPSSLAELADDDGTDCGRWRNGSLTGDCMAAGTEYCMFDCPFARRAARLAREMDGRAECRSA